ncbi:MAG TPA: 1-acyl-sn-glycerol-3-phosphate acyltransferase [Candidatus Corynebacterium intestinavium]|uniref:1-acyl-sn-glycerol-3-phosphate acyltransferase n=1 Tax=Candidatus Corynebacterium intestinavium TaxID=2838531 RepID=A0A9D2UB08_9CORY|nr:1-acyl-sn-glycerol-3-phosphate acyltransferase [Candidatus Corynebacterium intestinavium]
MRNRTYWWLKHVFIGPWLWIYNRPFTRGLDKPPADGPVIFASNHLAVMDSFYFPLVNKRQLTFLAKKEYFTTPGVVGAIQRWFFSSVGQVPIDRADKGSQEAALQTALRVLEKGDALGMYPEGTRSPDGRLYRGKTGMARIALESGVKVYPVAMINTDKVNPIGSWIPRPYRCGVIVGDPIDPADFKDAGDDYQQARALTDRVMEELAKLSGQEYVKNFYAADVKNSLAAGQGYPEGSAPGDGVVYS